MYSTHRIAILIFLLLSCFLLNSCDSAPQEKFQEGNIDVDSDIYIVPIGDNVDEKYLHLLVPKLEKRFTTKVHVALDKRMSNPDSAYDYEAACAPLEVTCQVSFWTATSTSANSCDWGYMLAMSSIRPAIDAP